MGKITVSAPGKLMLLGEHAVVYHHPCLVITVDQRIQTTVEVIDRNEFQLEARDVGISGYKKPISKLGKGHIPKGAKFVEIAVANSIGHPELVSGFRNKFGMTKEMGIRIKTESEFPSQYGFGSSSAVTVCVIKALSELFNLKLSKKEIFNLAYKTVLDIQGKGSGFDIAAAVYGGTLYFLTGGKTIEFLNVPSIPLIVGYSGVKSDTAVLVNKVKKSFSNKKNRLDEIYNSIEVLVNKAKAALIKKDWEMLGDLMNQNQNYLKELGVSTPKLDNMIKAALNGGAYGAKLSGAGGGDCMVAVVSDEKRGKVIGAIQSAGGEIIDIKTGAEGVRIE